jgi:hypothetical protein
VVGTEINPSIVAPPQVTLLGLELLPTLFEKSIVVLDLVRINLALVAGDKVKLCMIVFTCCGVYDGSVPHEDCTSVDGAAKLDRREGEEKIEAGFQALA